MSDSFADLWSSSAPLPPKPKPQTLSSASTTFNASSSSQRPMPNQTARTNAKPDVFSLLASSGSSNPTPRYGSASGFSSSSSANLAGSTPSSRPLTPAMSRSASGTPAPGSSSVKGGGDAFSDLFSSSSTSTNGNTNGSTKLTLAVRLAMESQQRGRGAGSPPILSQQQTKGTGAASNDTAWAGLDSLAAGGLSASSSISVPKVATNKQAVEDDDDWGLGDFGAPKTTSKSTAQRQPQPQQKKAATLWDLDEFTSPSPAPSGASGSGSGNNIQRPISQSTSSQGTRKQSSSLVDTDAFLDAGVTSPDADFDFGNREDRVDEARQRHRSATGKARQQRSGLLDLDGEDEHGYGQGREMGRGLLDDDADGDAGWGQTSAASRTGHQDEDDILGMLSKPVEVVKARVGDERSDRSNPDAENSRPRYERTTATRGSSPPPHILGQIVEMGFSVEQAKKALKETKDGQDVQAALESLLAGGGSAEQSYASAGGGYMEERGRPFASESAAPPPPTRSRGAPKGQKERERERLERQRQAALREGGEGSAVPASVAEIQEHADKLLAQASEIGLSVFSKASAFWKEGTEKVVKAYEERRGDVGTRGGTPAGGGRPKWMQEVVHQSDDEDDGRRDRGGFKDTHEREEVISKPVVVKTPEVEVDLFSDSVPQRNAPPQRPKPQLVRHPSSSSQAQQRPPAPPPPTRNLASASSSALAHAQKHKTLGTEQFKLGQHAAAAESYTAAISALPQGHLLLVPLHTNRALARLKTGEYAGAFGDCQNAVEGVFGKDVFSSSAGKEKKDDDGFGFEDPLAPKKDASSSSTPPPLLNPSVIPPSLVSAGISRANEGGWSNPQGVGVDLLDGYVKALRRAAEACEGREKWVDAGMWWGVLSRAGEGEGAGWVEEKTRKEAISGGVRCRKMIDEASGLSASSVAGPGKSAAPTSIPAKPKTKLKPRSKPATPAEPSRALLALQKAAAQAESEDAAKHVLKDTVDARLSAWRTGKEANIRALLASLESVLWAGAITGGLKMGMADLVSPAQVKKGYVKAIAKVHPDKLNASNSTIEQRMLANGVFGALNEAWIAFQAAQK